MIQNVFNFGWEYWATRSSARSFARTARCLLCALRCAHLFARSLSHSLLSLWDSGIFFFSFSKSFESLCPKKMISFIILIICRCAAASLYEDVSVCRSICKSVTPSLGHALHFDLWLISRFWCLLSTYYFSLFQILTWEKIFDFHNSWLKFLTFCFTSNKCLIQKNFWFEK